MRIKSQLQRVLLVGNGHMEKGVIQQCGKEKVGYRKFSPTGWYHEQVAIHVGSGREFPALLHHCERHRIPIIQCSSGIVLPEVVPVPIVSVSNAALSAQWFFQDLEAQVNIYRTRHPTWCLVESHQAEKTTVSATALHIANILGIPHDEIISIRDTEDQLKMGIPREHLAAHAYHRVSGVVGEGKIELSLEIHGREEYAEGILRIAKMVHLVRNDLQNQVYPAKYFLKHLLV